MSEIKIDPVYFEINGKEYECRFSHKAISRAEEYLNESIITFWSRYTLLIPNQHTLAGLLRQSGLTPPKYVELATVILSSLKHHQEFKDKTIDAFIDDLDSSNVQISDVYNISGKIMNRAFPSPQKDNKEDKDDKAEGPEKKKTDGTITGK